MDSVEPKTMQSNNDGAHSTEQGCEIGRGIPMRFVSEVGKSSLRSFRDEAEVHAISNTLKLTNWNRKRAARLLRVSYRGLLYKIRRHNIRPDSAGRHTAGPEVRSQG